MTGELVMSANDLNVVDVIPQADSSETGDNSEPSIGVNPADPTQLIAASFGGSSIPGANAPYFVSLNGGTTWSNFGALTNSDKTIAWVPSGSAVLTATLVSPDQALPLGADPDEGGSDSQLNMYSASQSEVTGGGDFGSTINNFVGSDHNDQPWLRISADVRSTWPTTIWAIRAAAERRHPSTSPLMAAHPIRE
jgi:hypothetical protein